MPTTGGGRGEMTLAAAMGQAVVAMADLFPHARSAAGDLRALLDRPEVLVVPGCFDALSARLVEAAGHEAAFCGGFSVAATRLGLPDVGLLSYGEMVDQLTTVTAATAVPVIADADTGYGNAINAQRSLLGFARAGAACVMIEDQEWPKQCGHTTGKRVIERTEAVARVRAAVEMRDEHGLDVLVMARTDAAGAVGFDEALHRATAFAAVGADLTFLEAPQSIDQMSRYCAEVPGHKVANLVEDGRTPWLDPTELGEIGYSVALYPVSLLLHAGRAMENAAVLLRGGRSEGDRLAFDEMRRAVGWNDYDDRLERYEQQEED
ncbi:MAG: isocitrate lyase/PEP mutase family protein [Acidimicrobiales bacterium]